MLLNPTVPRMQLEDANRLGLARDGKVFQTVRSFGLYKDQVAVEMALLSMAMIQAYVDAP